MPLDPFTDHAERAEAYRLVFSDPAAERVLADILRFAGHDRLSFRPGDPTLTSYHEGQRSVALHITRSMTEKTHDRAADDGRDDGPRHHDPADYDVL